MQPEPTPAHSAPAQPADTTPAANTGAHATERYLEILDRLLATGVEIADNIRRNNRDNPADAVTASRELDRVSRNLRRCMLLARRLQEARPARRTRSPARASIRALIPQAPGPDRLDSIGTGTIPEILADLARDLEALAARHAPKAPLPPQQDRLSTRQPEVVAPPATPSKQPDHPARPRPRPVCLAGCRSQTAIRTCTPERPPQKPRRR